jgi:hypothetical protein
LHAAGSPPEPAALFWLRENAPLLRFSRLFVLQLNGTKPETDAERWGKSGDFDPRSFRQLKSNTAALERATGIAKKDAPEWSDNPEGCGALYRLA